VHYFHYVSHKRLERIIKVWTHCSDFKMIHSKPCFLDITLNTRWLFQYSIYEYVLNTESWWLSSHWFGKIMQKPQVFKKSLIHILSHSWVLCTQCGNNVSCLIWMYGYRTHFWQHTFIFLRNINSMVMKPDLKSKRLKILWIIWKNK
jgi:hypothetical protein